MRAKASRSRLPRSRYDPTADAALMAAPGFARDLSHRRQAPIAGATRRQPRLAETLAQLAHAGLDDFYRGDVGREIAADLERIGSPVTRADLKRYEAAWREPLSLRIEGATLYNTPAPTQGLASLMLLGLYERLGVSGVEGFAHAHALIEATKRALTIRNEACVDFAYATHDFAALLSASWLDAQAARIDMNRAAPWPSAARQGRHGLDGRDRRQGPRRLLHPVGLLGIRLGLRAADDRRDDAEPRPRLLARARRAQPAASRPAAVPHAQSAARGVRRRPGALLWFDGRRRAAAVPGAGLHPHRRRPDRCRR